MDSAFLRLLAALTLALQAVLGSAHLTLEVCHGNLHLPASDGSPCCAAGHCDEGEGNSEFDRISVLSAPCSDCFSVELTGFDGPVDVPGTVELPAPPTYAAVGVAEFIRVVADVRPVALSPRAPPDCLSPTGLLPGVFPLRI